MKMHQLILSNMVNFGDFLVVHVSEGSVSTYVRCGEMTTYRCIANFRVSLLVKECFKFDRI